MTPDDLSDGDIVEVRFDPPVPDADHGAIAAATGPVRIIVGKAFLIAESHRRTWAMPACLDLGPASIRSIRMIERAGDVAARKQSEARGDLVFEERPSTGRTLEEQIETLAGLIASETDDRILGGRRSQFERQFGDICDLVSLARTKRAYLRLRAVLGREFHPWTDGDPRIFRNGTVRPLLADLDLDPALRKDRDRRLEDSVRIFGEAEREVRRIAAALRRQGYHVRRPHPNAQELLVRLGEKGKTADMEVKPSPNGLWEAAPKAPENKTRARHLRRVLSGGGLEARARDLDAGRA